jgi:hypothetical protein
MKTTANVLAVSLLLVLKVSAFDPQDLVKSSGVDEPVKIKGYFQEWEGSTPSPRSYSCFETIIDGSASPQIRIKEKPFGFSAPGTTDGYYEFASTTTFNGQYWTRALEGKGYPHDQSPVKEVELSDSQPKWLNPYTIKNFKEVLLRSMEMQMCDVSLAEILDKNNPMHPLLSEVKLEEQEGRQVLVVRLQASKDAPEEKLLIDVGTGTLILHESSAVAEGKILWREVYKVTKTVKVNDRFYFPKEIEYQRYEQDLWKTTQRIDVKSVEVLKGQTMADLVKYEIPPGWHVQDKRENSGLPLAGMTNLPGSISPK